MYLWLIPIDLYCIIIVYHVTVQCRSSEFVAERVKTWTRDNCTTISMTLRYSTYLRIMPVELGRLVGRSVCFGLWPRSRMNPSRLQMQYIDVSGRPRWPPNDYWITCGPKRPSSWICCILLCWAAMSMSSALLPNWSRHITPRLIPLRERQVFSSASSVITTFWPLITLISRMV